MNVSLDIPALTAGLYDLQFDDVETPTGTE